MSVPVLLYTGCSPAFLLPATAGCRVGAQMLREGGMAGLHRLPLWLRGLGAEELLAEYLRECAIVRRGINSDLDKVRPRTRGQALI